MVMLHIYLPTNSFLSWKKQNALATYNKQDNIKGKMKSITKRCAKDLYHEASKEPGIIEVTTYVPQSLIALIALSNRQHG